MRIAMVNSIRSYGGGEKRVLRGAHEFRRRGHEVLVIGRPGAELTTRAREQQIPCAEAPLRHYLSPASIVALASRLRRFGPEVVVSYDEKAVRLCALAGLLRRRRPALVHYYGLEGAFKNKPHNRYVVGPRVDCFLCNASALRDELRSFGWILERKLRVIHGGVDPAPIEEADPAGVREELGAAPGDIVALVVARLVPEKGHAFLVDALRKVVPGYPQLRVWLAGDGPDAEGLERQGSELGLSAAVRLLGFRADVPRLLRAADLMIHPSRREGAPNSVREGMVARLPVAAVAASGTPEVVVDGETGLLSPVGDAEAFRRNLERLLSDADLRRRMGEAGRRRALAEFSEDRCAERWLELLEEVRRK